MSGFNVFFTSLPPLVIGLFEKDVSENVLQRVPGAWRLLCLAAQSHSNVCSLGAFPKFKEGNPMSLRRFFGWMTVALWHSLGSLCLRSFVIHSIHLLGCMNSVVLCAAFCVRGYRRVGLDG